MTGTALVHVRRPPAYCHPMTAAAVLADCHARWALSNPIEIRKELDMMRAKGVRSEIVDEGEAVLVGMIIARSGQYKPSTAAI